MATSQYKGTADILYTPLGGTQLQHLLAVPLLVTPRQGFRSTRRKRRWEVWNDDWTERETFVLGSTAVDEINGIIRMDNEPAALRSLLTEALDNNVSITYRPAGASGASYPCLVVGILGAQEHEIVLTPDRDRFAFGEWQVGLHLRRVDGGTFEGLL